MSCARNRRGCYKRRKEEKHSWNKNTVDVKTKNGQRRENGEKRKKT